MSFKSDFQILYHNYSCKSTFRCRGLGTSNLKKQCQILTFSDQLSTASFKSILGRPCLVHPNLVFHSLEACRSASIFYVKWWVLLYISRNMRAFLHRSSGIRRADKGRGQIRCGTLTRFPKCSRASRRRSRVPCPYFLRRLP